MRSVLRRNKITAAGDLVLVSVALAICQEEEERPLEGTKPATGAVRITLAIRQLVRHHFGCIAGHHFGCIPDHAKLVRVIVMGRAEWKPGDI
jgi:hypothetical protein